MKRRVVLVCLLLSGLAVGLVISGRLQLGRADDSDVAVQQAEEWLGINLQPGERLVVDDTVRGDLAHAGWPASALASKAGTATLWTGYAYVVSTPALRAHPTDLSAKALASSTLVATFGDDDSQRTDVLRIDPSGAAVAQARDAALRTASTKAGKQLATSHRVVFGPEARSELLDGDVDPNVLAALVALGAQHSVTVSGFANPASEGATLGLLRQFTLTTIDGVPVNQGARQTIAVQSWFAAQTGQFRAGTLGIEDGALLIGLRLSSLDSYGQLSQPLPPSGVSAMSS